MIIDKGKDGVGIFRREARIKCEETSGRSVDGVSFGVASLIADDGAFAIFIETELLVNATTGDVILKIFELTIPEGVLGRVDEVGASGNITTMIVFGEVDELDDVVNDWEMVEDTETGEAGGFNIGILDSFRAFAVEIERDESGERRAVNDSFIPVGVDL